MRFGVCQIDNLYAVIDENYRGVKKETDLVSLRNLLETLILF